MLRMSIAVAALLAGLGCSQGAPAPQVAFVVTAGDSSFWVTTSDDRLATRRSDVLLARLEGDRLVETYLVDHDFSFPRASIVGQRMYRRDIVTGDSALVRYDSVAATVARDYAAAHPGLEPLGPDDELEEELELDASTDTHIEDAVGPFASVDLHVDVVANDVLTRHESRRMVVDLRTGERAKLTDLMSPREAARVVALGKRHFTTTLDSLKSRAEAAQRDARAVLNSLAFDSTSFSLAAGYEKPVLVFAASGRGSDGGGQALSLGEIPFEPSAWWSLERRALPTRFTESSAQWGAGDYTVDAAVSKGDTSAAIIVEQKGVRVFATEVPLPVRRVFRVPLSPQGEPIRRALTSRFNEAETAVGITPTRETHRCPVQARRHKGLCVKNLPEKANRLSPT